MLTRDPLGWLRPDDGDPRVVVVPAHSSRMGTFFSAPSPRAPVWHTTDTRTPAALVAKHWTGDPLPGLAASAHVIVGRDGVIYQSVPINRIAWHTRGGGVVAGREVASVNSCTIGIELENVGGLRRILDAQQRPAFYGWPYWRRDASSNPRESLGPDALLRLVDARAAGVQLVGGRWCDGFTVEQIGAATALLLSLARLFGWRREWCGKGHVDYEPKRKEDPWPLFRAKHLPGILDTAFPTAAPAALETR